MKKHDYQIFLDWTGNTGNGTTNYKAYLRNYTIRIDGKPDINGSSDPSFRGDKNRHNPEELFLASISSCHMLWYLHLCSLDGVTVVDYRDSAIGVMIEKDRGSGYFKSVTLQPEVIILEPHKREKAKKLHHKANEMCFIANSCNFEIKHVPSIQIARNDL